MRLAAMLTLLMMLTGCSDAGPEPEGTSSSSDAKFPEALSLVRFENGLFGKHETTLRGSASVSDVQDAGYTLSPRRWPVFYRLSGALSWPMCGLAQPR